MHATARTQPFPPPPPDTHTQAKHNRCVLSLRASRLSTLPISSRLGHLGSYRAIHRPEEGRTCVQMRAIVPEVQVAAEADCSIRLSEKECGVGMGTNGTGQVKGIQMGNEGGSCDLQSVIELSRTQDENVGDGTTSVIILGALCPPCPLLCIFYLFTHVFLGGGVSRFSSKTLGEEGCPRMQLFVRRV